MAKVKITGHASGSGVLTITAPNTSTDRTVTLPDSTGTLLDTTSGLDATKLSGNLPALNGASLTSVNAVNGGRKNLIINGDMRVQQRGTASVTTGYFVDRFQLSGCSASAVLTSSTPTEFPTAISVTATSGNPIASQKIESKNCQHLSGQTVIVSFYAKNISNATTLYTSLATANAADNFGATTTISEQNLGSLTGSWVKYTASWTVPAGGLNGLGLNILCAGTGTFTMGVTGVQLELGSVATDFEHRSFGEELALCQRYYEKSYAQGVAVGTASRAGSVGSGGAQGQTSTGEIGGGTIQFSVEKRVTPTVTFYDSAGTSGKGERLNAGIAWFTNSTMAIPLANAKHIVFVSTTGNAATGAFAHYTADAEL